MRKTVVRLNVDLTVKDSQLDEFKKVALAMTAGSEWEQGTLGYEWFSSADGRQWRLLEIYADAAAVLAHFKGPVVTELVPKLAALCTVDRFEIYGDAGPQVTQMAGALGARTFAYTTGLTR